MFSFTVNKSPSVSCAPTAPLWLLQSLPELSLLAASNLLLFFMLHICCFKALWCSGHSRGTQCYSHSVCHHPLFLLSFSKFICERLSDLTFPLYQVKQPVKSLNLVWCTVHIDFGTQLIVRKISVTLTTCKALMEGKSSFRRSATMLCLEQYYALVKK